MRKRERKEKERERKRGREREKERERETGKAPLVKILKRRQRKNVAGKAKLEGVVLKNKDIPRVQTYVAKIFKHRL